MKDLTLRKRLYAGFGAVITVLAVLAAYVTFGISSVDRDVDRLWQVNVANERSGTVLQSEFDAARMAVLRYFANPTDAGAAALRGETDGYEATLRAELVAMDGRIVDEGLRVQLRAFETVYDEMVGLLDAITTDIEAGDLAAAGAGLAGVTPVAFEAQARLAEYRDGNRTAAEDRFTAIDVSTDRIRSVTVLASLFGVALAFGIGWFITRQVNRQVGDAASSVTGSSEELAAVSAQMGAAAEETATQANVVAAAGEQVSHNVQTVATAVEEMNASVREIAQSANEAQQVASEAVRRRRRRTRTWRSWGSRRSRSGRSSR
jgi:methyl-accepting chemotaxis protein